MRCRTDRAHHHHHHHLECQRQPTYSTISRPLPLPSQAAIKYEEDDLTGARSLLEDAQARALSAGTAAGAALAADLAVNAAAIAYKEGRFDEARAAFTAAAAAGGGAGGGGYAADLAYNVALCWYASGVHASALAEVGRIIERGVREHPELSVGARTDGVDVRSVGNTQALR